MDIADKIYKMRRERGWSEYRLAEEADIKQSTISSWYRENKSSPQVDSLKKVCSAFGITLAQLVAEEGEPVPLTPEQQRILDLWNARSAEQKELVLHLLEQMK